MTWGLRPVTRFVFAATVSFLPVFAHAQQAQWNSCIGKNTSATARISSCTAVIDAATESPENLSIAYSSRGAAYGEKGDQDSALRDLDKAIELDSKNSAAYYNRALSYVDKHDYEHALHDFDQVMKLSPPYYQALLHRGMSYTAKGEADRAVPDFDQVIKNNPRDAAAFF